MFVAGSSPIEEQLLVESQADIVVQTHGAALGNLMFIKEVILASMLNLAKLAYSNS